MKLQYLGDSKDSFKWDYHHFLMEALGYSQLTIAWMLTPDDGGADGNTAPELFAAREEIINFCHQLRDTRNANLLLELPETTGARYTVSFHETEESLGEPQKNAFFSGIKANSDHIVFLDPDNGFEPKRTSTDKHVRYADLDRLVRSIPPNAVVTVFQHHRRKKFPDDFARIRERLLSGYSTAVYWHSLMFVCVSSSKETIHRVSEINREYAKQRPVKVIT